MGEILYNTVGHLHEFRENRLMKACTYLTNRSTISVLRKTARVFESKRRLGDVTKYLKQCLENRRQLPSDCVLSGIQAEDEDTAEHRAHTTTDCSTPTDEINAGISIMKRKKL